MAHRFSFSGNKITYNGQPIDTNDIVTEELKYRFFADICKDAYEAPVVKNIYNILQQCLNSPITGNYKSVLDKIDEKYWPEGDDKTSFIKERTIVENNLLKASTDDGSTFTQISDAGTIFYESGMGPERVTRNQRLHKIATPATILDTATKDLKNVEFYPDRAKDTIVFDETFMTALGFPRGMTWSSNLLSLTSVPQYNVTIQYPVPTNPTVSSVVKPLTEVKERPSRFGEFVGYSKGNTEKNKEINSMTKTDCEKIIKILLTKELGDVAQVWMYLAYVIIQKMNRMDALMVTVDHVVLLFCAILDLSCMYTGGRSGVTQRGNCRLIYYTAGEVDYFKKLSNMLMIKYKLIREYNEGQLAGLTDISNDIRKFKYITSNIGRQKGQFGTNLKTEYGDFQVATEKIPGIRAAFQKTAQVIAEKNARLEKDFRDVMERIKGMDINKGNIDSIVEKFSTKIAGYKHAHVITKVKIPGIGDTIQNMYILLPGELLTEYAAIASIPASSLPTNIDDFIQTILNEVQNLEATNKALKERKVNPNMKITKKLAGPRTAKPNATQKREERIKERVGEQGKARETQIAQRRGVQPVSARKTPTSGRKTATKTRRSASRKMRGGDDDARVLDMKDSGIGYYECLILFVLYYHGINDPIALPVLYDVVLSRVSPNKNFNDVFRGIFKGSSSKNYFNEVFDQFSDEEIMATGLELADTYFSFSKLPGPGSAKTSVASAPAPALAPAEAKSKDKHTPTGVAHSPSELN